MEDRRKVEGERKMRDGLDYGKKRSMKGSDGVELASCDQNIKKCKISFSQIWCFRSNSRREG